MTTMKKTFIFTLTVILLLLCMALPVSAAKDSHPFNDVSDSAWYAPYVEYVYQHGLMEGTSKTTFAPNQQMTRCMLVTVLWRMDGSGNTTGSTPFADVQTNGYYYNALVWAYQNGIITGTSPNTFSPNAPITREMMVTIFYRYAESQGKDTGNLNNLNQYTDREKIAGYAKIPFQWAVQAGVINGNTDTTLNPRGTATRAECATILKRFRELNAAESGLENFFANRGYTNYDADLTPPTVIEAYAKDGEPAYFLCQANPLDVGCEYEVVLARDANFTTGLLSGTSYMINGNDTTVRISNFYDYNENRVSNITGTYYYMVRTIQLKGGFYTYGPWSEAGTLACLDFTNKRTDKDTQYRYELYFVDHLSTEIYTSAQRAIYIKTNNPDPNSIRLTINGKKILAADPVNYLDVTYLDPTDTNCSLRKVPGGYIGGLYVGEKGNPIDEAMAENNGLIIEENGTYTAEVWEATKTGYTVAKTFPLKVLAYTKELNRWCKSVIDSQTNSSMTPKEKMDAVERYLTNGQFKYFVTDGNIYLNLAADPNSPDLQTKRWNSYISPSRLYTFASMIGGFEEIHNCYGDDLPGTTEWMMNHANIYVVYNGQKYIYSACPGTSTGKIDTIPMIDFNNTSRFTSIK